MCKYSIIIPVYNRPDEVNELLESLVDQTFQDFEVIIVEDGSSEKCEEVVDHYKDRITIIYFFKPNSGQGFSRNEGSEKASGKWLIFFDSDCIIPNDYLQNLDWLINENHQVHAFCGPDAARKDFSPLQKALSYSMTSLLTTGGIRGKKKKVDREPHLRSYNLVIEVSVFKALNGFNKTNMGEDMELSYRFQKAGFVALISDKLTVYHKRRNTLKSFFKQVFSFGRTRIQLKRDFKIPIKLPHIFPSLFTLGLPLSIVFLVLQIELGYYVLIGYLLYFISILIHASIIEKNFSVGVLAVAGAFIQHIGYGSGFISESLKSKKR